MKTGTTKLTLFALLLLLSSCAASYKSILPQSLSYANVKEQEGVKIAYKYDVLLPANKKFHKKEKKFGTKLVAVQLTNNTSQDLVVGQSLKIATSTSTLELLPTEAIVQKLRQKAEFHLFYLLLTPMTLTTATSTSGATETTPIGLGVGPGLTALNMGIGFSANAKFREELDMYSLIGKTIKAGETVHGLIGINTYEPVELSAKVYAK